MTTIQHQRTIGVALLFILIIGIAVLLIRSADDGVVTHNEQQVLNLDLESHDDAETTEPYVSEAIVNLEKDAQHSDELTLAQTVVEPNTAPAPIPTPVPTPASKPAPAPIPKSVPKQVVSPAPTPKAAPKQAVTPTPKPTVTPKPAPIPKPVVATTPKPAPVVKAEQAATTAWVVQLASFSVKANADALSLQAKEMGYKSVIESGESSSGKVYRVRLEPIADKEKAQAVANTINQKLKLTTQVMQE